MSRGFFVFFLLSRIDVSFNYHTSTPSWLFNYTTHHEVCQGGSQILLRNYYFECLGGTCIPTFETLPQEVSVYSPWYLYYTTLCGVCQGVLKTFFKFFGNQLLILPISHYSFLRDFDTHFHYPAVVSSPLDIIYYTILFFIFQDGNFTKSKETIEVFFVHFVGRPGSPLPH